MFDPIRKIAAAALAFALFCVPLAGCSGTSQASSASAESSASQQVSAGEISVSVVVDPSVAAETVDVSALKPFEEPSTYTLYEGATAYDALDALAVPLEGDPSYVTSIDGIGEDAYGVSGWMYEVNGETPMVAANEYVLEDGDTVRWYYSTWE